MIGSNLKFRIISGNENYVQMLIEAGANVNHTAVFDDQPLHIAAQFGMKWFMN